MLSSLHIENFALIDILDIDLPPGMTIITGETGAGKSIMLGALALLLGGRAGTQTMRDPGRRIVVEAVFREVAGDLMLTLDPEGVDVGDSASGDTLILRREVLPSGRSRAFINDSPVNIKQLGDAASHLIDIHSQHSNMLISRPEFQLQILDSIAGSAQLLDAYRSVFGRYVALRRELRQRRDALARNREQEEYLAFRLERLRTLKPRAGEQAELERKIEVLSAAEEIRAKLGAVCRLLDGGEQSALSSLHEARTCLATVRAAALPDGDGASGEPTLPERLESAEIEVRDVAETLHDVLVGVEADPSLLQRTESRLEAIYAEEKYFGVNSDTGLVAIMEDLESRMNTLSGGDADLHALEKDARKAGAELKEAAGALTAARRRAAETFSEELVRMARTLGMPNILFSASVDEAPRMTSGGADMPQFLCAFNRKQPLRSISEIASGGELSRLMLCVKAIVAGKMRLPTIIFDEVDTGVSGDIADRMGRLMRSMSADIQVIAITHLPQVAVMGDAHFKVYKQDEADATYTHVALLTPDGREREVARMLSGSVIDEAAMLNARSLLARDGGGNGCGTDGSISS